MQVVLKEQIQWRWSSSVSDYFSDDSKTLMALGRPLNQFGIIQAGDGNYKLIWTIHHALHDAWTLDMVIDHVSRIYHNQELDSGPGFNLFVDFIQKQQNQSFEYWKSSLCGAGQCAVFPELLRIKVKAQPKSQVERKIPIPNVQPPGFTIASLIRSAWAILMSRLTGSDKVVFGETFLGRSVPIEGIEKMRGPTSATVPVLVQIDRQQTVEQFLTVLQEQVIYMQTFEHYGLQNISKINEDSKTACNFQTLLIVHPSPDHSTTQSHAESVVFELEKDNNSLSEFNSYPLLLLFAREGKQLRAEANFDPTIVSTRMVDFVLWQLQCIFTTLCTGTISCSLGDLEIARPEELAKIWK